MIKTEYFMVEVQYNRCSEGLNSVKAKRDEFLHDNKSKIVKIKDEDIAITNNTANNMVIFVIKLSYYEK
jgi:hypothetical protein